MRLERNWIKPKYFDLIEIYLQNTILNNVFVVQSLSHVRLSVTPWTAACQASLSLTTSWSSPKVMSIESVITFNHLILCCPLLFCLQSFPASGFLQWVSCSYQVAKVLELQLQNQSFQWVFRFTVQKHRLTKRLKPNYRTGKCFPSCATLHY